MLKKKSLLSNEEIDVCKKLSMELREKWEKEILKKQKEY
jgi:hypothetical protein